MIVDAYTDRVLEMKDRSRIGKWNCKREILKDKLLSFVNEQNIVKCYMYGDILTKFNLDNTNKKFKEIRNS